MRRSVRRGRRVNEPRWVVPGPSLLALLVRFTSTKVPCLAPKKFTNTMLGRTRRTSLFLRIGKDGGF